MNSRPAARALRLISSSLDFLDLRLQHAFGGGGEQALGFFEQRAHQDDVGGLGRAQFVGHLGGGDADDARLRQREVLRQAVAGCRG